MATPDEVMRTQVLIVGAGPTGLSLAAQLIRHGISFVLLEKKEGITHLSKAVVVHARSLEIFEELGLAEKAVQQGARARGMKLYYKGRQKASIDIDTLGKGLSNYPYALSLEQSKTERLLSEHITSQGNSISWNCEVTGIHNTSDGVSVTYQAHDGKQKKIQADYLVGCDGAGSLTRHQLGLSFGGDTVPRIFYVADVLLSSPVINEDRMYMFMIPKGFVLMFPMDGTGHYRVIGIIPEATESNMPRRFSEIAADIEAEIAVPVQFEKEIWFSTYKVHTRKVDNFSLGRCFLAGDAAHIHTPAGGQGMNTGIQDAYNLSWKLAMVLKKEANGKILDTYNSEREHNARNLLASTDKMFEFMTGRNVVTNFLRLHFFPVVLKNVVQLGFVRKAVFPALSQTGIAYPKSRLSVPGAVGGVRAGDRMPFFLLADGSHIFEHISQPRFKLLFMGTGQVDEPGNCGTIVPELIHIKEIPPIFGKAANFYLLLRPDNHISYIGNDMQQCRNFMKSISFPGS